MLFAVRSSDSGCCRGTESHGSRGLDASRMSDVGDGPGCGDDSSKHTA